MNAQTVKLGLAASLGSAALAAAFGTWLLIRGGMDAAAGGSLLAFQLLVLAAAAHLVTGGLLRPLSRITAQLGSSGAAGGLESALADADAGRQDAERAAAALQCAMGSIMLVDSDHRIVFMNTSVKSLFREHVQDFRTAFPNFDPDDILGKSMGVFHKNPAHQERMLERLSQPHVARIRMGRRTFDLLVTPVVTAQGERRGAMLEWRDMTAEVAMQDQVSHVAKNAAAGDFSGRIPLEDKSGFMREISSLMNELCAATDAAISDFTRTATVVAAGDLTQPITQRYGGKLGDLKEALNETIARLADAVTTIQTTAIDVATASREINSGADDLSRRTEEQASSLEQTAATTEELAASVKASAQSSRQAVDLAEEATRVAQTGGQIVNEAVEAMARIEAASQKISDITSVIDDIAFQTNLLALNAAVEAARAGEAGKGFAVVASEVRTLAQRSSEAAKDITGLITSSSSEVAQGVKLVRSAGDTLGRIVEASQKVAGTVSEISSASTEQASGIDEMSQAVAHMDEMTQQNAALAEQSAASAGALTSQLQRLNDLVATFRTAQAPRAAAPAVAPAAPPADRPTSEPARLRRLAADAFAARSHGDAGGGAKASAAKPAPKAPPPPARAARAAASRPSPARRAGNDGASWEEF
ncbi:methyl-accepting chemotaxis protein [Alsobacter sp. SYSU BS001988]